MLNTRFMVGQETQSNRTLYLLEVNNVEEVPERFFDEQRYFVALIVWDASSATSTELTALAAKLIQSGGVCYSSWGPDCERVHDAIDREWIDNTWNQSEDTILTAWHSNESLDDAIWFVLFNSHPMSKFEEHCRAVVAVCIAHPAAAERIRIAFRNPAAFDEKVLHGKYSDDDLLD